MKMAIRCRPVAEETVVGLHMQDGCRLGFPFVCFLSNMNHTHTHRAQRQSLACVNRLYCREGEGVLLGRSCEINRPLLWRFYCIVRVLSFRAIAWHSNNRQHTTPRVTCTWGREWKRGKSVCNEILLNLGLRIPNVGEWWEREKKKQTQIESDTDTL